MEKASSTSGTRERRAAADFGLAGSLQRAEEKLREASELRQKILASLDDALFVSDPSHRTIIACNEAVERIFGYKREEVVGQNAAFLHVNRASYEEFGHKLFLALDAAGVFRAEFSMRRKDGSVFPAEHVVTQILDASGHRTTVVCAVRDITARKKSEEALRELSDQVQALSRQMTKVEEAERRALATELHDRVGQNLTALDLNLNIVRARLSMAGSEGKALSRLEDSLALTRETIGLVRDLTGQLRPPLLDDYGLMAALRWQAEQFSVRTDVMAAVHGEDLSPRLPSEAEIALLRIAQEALTNVVKHARARRVTVALEAGASGVSLTIEDDGRGFSLAGGEALPYRGWGLAIMQERAHRIGGRLEVKTALGKGTKVVAWVPR